MKTRSTTILFATAALFMGLAAPANAGGPVTVTYGPITPVPALGGALLVALAVLLALIAFRLYRSGANPSLPIIAAFAVAGAASGGIGLQLFSEAQATAQQVPLTNPEGGQAYLSSGGSCLINNSGVPLNIRSIQILSGWELQLSGGGTCESVDSGGDYRGFCSDNPGTTLSLNDRCFLYAFNPEN